MASVRACSKVGENRRSSDQARALLLPTTGGEPPEETVVWQYAPADSRAAPSGGITEAAAPKKTIPISPGIESCLKKLVLEALME